MIGTNGQGKNVCHDRLRWGGIVDTLDINEAADFLRCHKETLRRLADSGELPGTKIGRAWVFVREDLIAYVRSKYDAKWKGDQCSLNIN